jgi:hypothetical protein
MHRHFSTAFAAISLMSLFAGPLSSDQLEPAREREAPAVVATQDNAPTVTVLGSKQAEGILGKKVRSAADENIGRLVDIVVDRTGHVRAAVIDFGGFFGVGSRKIAVDWNALSFASEGERDVITLDLTRDQLRAAPEYKDNRAVIVLGAAETPDQ